MYLKDTKLPTFRSFLVYALLAFFVIPTGAIAEGLMITPYMGYRVGGEFTDYFTGTKLELDSNESYGLIIGKDTGGSTQFEFIYGVQPTKLSAKGPFTPGVLIDMDIENYLIAGKKIMNQDSGAFVSGLVGATRFDPSSSLMSSKTRFALGIGGGIDHSISKRLGFRLEARAIATLFNTNGGVLCGNGGCLLTTSSNAIAMLFFSLRHWLA